MNLAFDSFRWDAVEAAHADWWARPDAPPIVHLTASGRDPGRPEPALPAHGFTSFYAPDVTPEAVADRLVYDLESTHFLGQSFPWVMPNFGPGVIAAFLGLELVNGEGTVWFETPSGQELRDLRPHFDRDNPWFQRLAAIYRALAGRTDGLVQLAMTDLGGNLDIAASLRGTEDLLMDLYDDPEGVEALVQVAHRAWWQVFDELASVIQRGHPGHSSWTPIYSREPFYILQCDFSYMISEDAFRRFALPEIVASCRRLTNSLYHLDGPGALKHLDALLEIPELKGVQWVPGAGQPGITEWPDVYRKIKAAGKRIQFFAHQDPLEWRVLEVLAGQLGGPEGLMMYGTIPATDMDEARAMIARVTQES